MVIVLVSDSKNANIYTAVKSPNGKHVFEKSYTLPSTLNGVIGIKRNQKHIFTGKMEILDEDDNPIPVLGQLPADVRNPGNVRTKSKKGSGVGSFVQSQAAL